MSNIVDINDIRKEFEERIKAKDLKSYAISQYATIERLARENQALKERLIHMEDTLKMLSKGDVMSSALPEEMICIEQIAGLKTKSLGRDLSLEETKKLELLVKTLKVIRDNPPKEKDTPPEFKEDEYVSIASRSE